MSYVSIIFRVSLLIVCWVHAAWSAEAPLIKGEAPEVSGYHDSTKSRLVYIEAKLVDYDQGCSEDAFNRSTRIASRGTGILLTKDRVLTAFHVALENLEPSFIRCFTVYRETDHKLRIARSVSSAGERSPQIASKDLAIIVLKDPIDDASLNSCPNLRKSLATEKEPLVIIGYDAKTIDLRVGTPITQPKAFPTQLVSPCIPPGLCEVNRSIPSGLSGGPVVDRNDNLVGIFKGGDGFTSSFEPLQEVLGVLEPICRVFLTEDYPQYCRTMNIEKREEKQSFNDSKKIQCDLEGKANDDKPLIRRAPDGSKISEFVSHEDKTDEAGIGWVGHVEYMLSDNDQYVKAVKVRLGCSKPPNAGSKLGSAETHIYGSTKKILTDKDYREINELCSKR